MSRKPDETGVATAFNAFTIDIFRKACETGDNAFISPFSVAMALAMVFIGARGATAGEMAKVMHLNFDEDILSRGVLDILESIRASEQQKKIKLSIANAIWIAEGLDLIPAYTARVKSQFKGAAFVVNFSPPEPTRIKINAWISEQTNKKIPELIGPGMLSPANKMVITNAIYFLGTWSKPFKKSDTRVKPFYPLSGQQASVSLMHAIIPCKYAEDAAVQYIELPYQGETMVMGIILPRRRDGLPEIEQKLSIDDFNHLSRFSMRQPVDIFLPRFKLDSTFDLEKTLQAMGMMLPFQPLVADFSGITGPPGVVISKLIHKAFVDVNEEGTEAAAATAILVLPSGAPGKPQPPPEFKADHPFIFIIKDTSTNAILFIGHVALPPPATASVTQVPFLPRGPPPPRR